MSRFVVTELEGYRTPIAGRSVPGISCHVIDTAVNHRLMASFRSEDDFEWNSTRAQRRTLARERAAALAARLNAETPWAT